MNSMKINYRLICFSSPLPPIPSVPIDNNFHYHSSEEYTNTVNYFDERHGEYEDIYSKTFNLSNTCSMTVSHRQNQLKFEGSNIKNK